MEGGGGVTLEDLEAIAFPFLGGDGSFLDYASSVMKRSLQE